ncbi:rRNA pseudouridine synthase [Persephonella atlantica]|uniref:Pseudouridine synthase n=1 Tax=Persephonella atlantica TaxID=2699429 RepID=A0ABS1GGH5_9AQUI|nr:pseudouridine synthase [Persephonella atlantica]MBK3332008.1 rRNA pseudouridine synthase [Persephonella atlantica]
MKKLRLDRYLSNAGIGSRKEVKLLIKGGRVTVNGVTIRDPSFQINLENDTVCIDGNPVILKKNHYFMFNKPSGYVTAKEDRYLPTVMEFFSSLPFYKKLFPVGRLDIDTEGLLIVTDDGTLAHRISHPKWEVEKEYYAVVKGNIRNTDYSRYEKEGIKLKDYKAKPFKIKLISASDEKSEITITVKEGKYHIVKRIMEKLGHPVLYLKRIRIGPIKLDEKLPTGEFREFTEEEIRQLKQVVNL